MSYEKEIRKHLELLRNHLRHNSNTTTGRITRVRDINHGQLKVECSAGDRYVSIEYSRHSGINGYPPVWYTANTLPKTAHCHGQTNDQYPKMTEQKVMLELRKILRKVFPGYDTPKEPWSPGLVSPLVQFKRGVITEMRKAGYAVEGNR